MSIETKLHDAGLSNRDVVDLRRRVFVQRGLRTSLLDPYRPELHYMRGPGPKWREKHGSGR